MKKQTTVPHIRKVIMEKDGLRYLAMPVQEAKGLYPGKWKCGKCTRGNIRPIIGLYDAPGCCVCGAFVRDIHYNDVWHGSMWDEKVFRYSHEPQKSSIGWMGTSGTEMADHDY